MENLIQADIFFFITTIVVVTFGILISIALLYFIKILADIREISRVARNESADIASDIQGIRREVKDEFRKNSSVLFSIIQIMRTLFRRRKNHNHKK